ncbi:MAG: 4Fe-4S dicluster domain-containing protein [bacterium]
MAKVLNFIIEKCTGCHQCELACSGVNAGVFTPDLSRIRIFLFPDQSKNVPYTCNQCEEAWCLHACPVQAITENPNTGAKELSDTVCVGCKVCTIACPYGTVTYQPSTGKVVKCDLCGGDPACVESCPTGAIQFAEGGAVQGGSTGAEEARSQ